MARSLTEWLWFNFAINWSFLFLLKILNLKALPRKTILAETEDCCTQNISCWAIKLNKHSIWHSRRFYWATYTHFSGIKRSFTTTICSHSLVLLFSSLPTTSIAAKSRKNSTLMRNRSVVDKCSAIWSACNKKL